MKAWSQNLGHEEPMTTFASYGTLSRHQQADIMGALARLLIPVEAADDSGMKPPAIPR
jgi:hypothetical protein